MVGDFTRWLHRSSEFYATSERCAKHNVGKRARVPAPSRKWWWLNLARWNLHSAGLLIFYSPQQVFGGQTIKLTCHLSLRFDLSTYLRMMTLPHTWHVQHTLAHTHTSPEVLTHEYAVRCASKRLWSFCPGQVLFLLLPKKIMKGR